MTMMKNPYEFVLDNSYEYQESDHFAVAKINNGLDPNKPIRKWKGVKSHSYYICFFYKHWIKIDRNFYDKVKQIIINLKA